MQKGLTVFLLILLGVTVGYGGAQVLRGSPEPGPDPRTPKWEAVRKLERDMKLMQDFQTATRGDVNGLMAADPPVIEGGVSEKAFKTYQETMKTELWAIRLKYDQLWSRQNAHVATRHKN